ncbi:prepilin-type N-terminal cleavage/methylation domain-containing protein [Alteribacillus iranensis]|uniref:Prepilin-type N-terminal cleavage/methylation domain-containing protein n=1 Tax=Alteribacillus iranensis TaxID=930128 RepID=A0A1I1ZEQ9_9BACI|nr:prepilin-type N-terminal cleavage/methylation domain-containing protein [Alteribacillus iranensis]SFE30226.1 prepilin-type N-terminal cleavage/methylation domain-containing protein [Alteribacillus iranensis]
MWRKLEKGMTLIEVVTALSILLIIFSLLLPIFQKVVQEKQSITQERKALYLVEKTALHIWKKGKNTSLPAKELKGYTSTSKKKGEGFETCIVWEGTNEREYEKCLYVIPKTEGNDSH